TPPRSSHRRRRRRDPPPGTRPGPGRPRPPPSASPRSSLRSEQRPVPELRRPVVHLVDVHVLHLGVLEDALEAELAADAALLVAAEWGGDREQVVVVDPHRA